MNYLFGLLLIRLATLNASQVSFDLQESQSTWPDDSVLGYSQKVQTEDGFGIQASFFISVDGTLPNDELLRRIKVKIAELYVTVDHLVEQALVLNEQVASLNAKLLIPPPMNPVVA